METAWQQDPLSALRLPRQQGKEKTLGNKALLLGWHKALLVGWHKAHLFGWHEALFLGWQQGLSWGANPQVGALNPVRECPVKPSYTFAFLPPNRAYEHPEGLFITTASHANRGRYLHSDPSTLQPWFV